LEKKLSVEELIETVEKIVNLEGDEEEIDNMINHLNRNVPHPNVSDLIFWNDVELTPKEIVEQALNYKAIKL
jgi:hypothetical protein